MQIILVVLINLIISIINNIIIYKNTYHGPLTILKIKNELKLNHAHELNQSNQKGDSTL